MRLSFKLLPITAVFCTLLTNVSYGAEEIKMSILDESFRREVRLAIKNSSQTLCSYCLSENEERFVEKREQLIASVDLLEKLVASKSQNSLESEWLMIQIKALQDMVKVYKESYNDFDDEEAAIEAVLHPALQAQWKLIKKSIHTVSLRNYLDELHSINLEKRMLEKHLEKVDERLALQTRMITAGENFLKWLDDKSSQDELAQAEIKALDELGILPPQTIESLREIVARLKEKPERA